MTNRWRAAVLPALFLLFGAACAAPIAPASAAPLVLHPFCANQLAHYVGTNGSAITYNGVPVPLRGFTFYPQDTGDAHHAWLSPSFQTYIHDRVFRDATALGQNLLRPLYQLDTQSGSNWNNPVLWQNMDYLVCQSRAHGVGVLLDLTFMSDVLISQGRDHLNPVNWYPLIDWLAPHYVNATNIYQVAFYSEPPHARSAADVTRLTSFYRAVMARWYARDPFHLLTPGGLGQLEDGYPGWWQAIYSLPHTASLGFEAYEMQDLAYQPTLNAWARAHHLILYLNEVGEPQYVGDAVYSGQPWDGITMSRSAFYRLVYGESVTYHYGISVFWNSGCQVGSGDFDVNSQTPAVVAVLRAYAVRPPSGTEYC